MLSLFLDFRRQAGVQATNRQLIFLISESNRSFYLPIPSASARRSGHYTLYIGLSDVLLLRAKSYANSKLGS